MRRNLLIALLTVVLFGARLAAQDVVTTDPSPLQESSTNVVAYFHADLGNKGLMGTDAETPLYAHTGVEVLGADGKTELWKYAPEWKENDDKYRLAYVSEDLWKLNIGDLREYYGVAADETITKLCFVFRNGNGTKEGKGDGNSDIFVEVMDSGFQLSMTKSYIYNIVPAGKTVKFTIGTTEDADIRLLVDNVAVGEAKGVQSLVAEYTFNDIKDYEVVAEATCNGKTLTEKLSMCVAGASQQASTSVVPPMGLTTNGANRTFCLAAPGKQTVMLIPSWNGYAGSNKYVMDYIDAVEEGATFRYFTITIPTSETGTEFSYYYNIDGTTNVGDPYAELVLDPQNDKYIDPEVYPNLPQYPLQGVPANVWLAYHKDGMLDYDWQVKDFKGTSKDNLVIYEMLIRDFTGTEGKAEGNGTLLGAIEKIPYLVELGVNAVELLPVNEFNGNNSWGYNPNFYFAIDKAYGSPQLYKEFIDKCHQNGIAVILDMVFNQSDWMHPWYRMYPIASNPFYNATAPHAYSVLNDWNQGYPLVKKQWDDVVQYWIKEYKVDGYRFDLVKGLGDNNSYSNSGDSGTNAYNASRVANMKRIHDAMRKVKADAYFINENLAGAKEENEMAEDGELNWANLNNSGCQFAMGYNSSSSLMGMLAKNYGRTAGSTVAYLESHDEERLAYKQTQWGVAGVKGNNKVSCQRLGSAAAQMILVPGSHMIWMFSELGNAQSTKSANGSNNTSPKIVNWALLDDPDNAGVFESYKELIQLRRGNYDLFTTTGDYRMNLATWDKGRTIFTTTDKKELYCVINPNVTGEITVTVPFRSDSNSTYEVVSKTLDSAPTFDAAAKTVTIPANCYVVVATDNVTGVEDVLMSDSDKPAVYYNLQGVRVSNPERGLYIEVRGGESRKVMF